MCFLKGQTELGYFGIGSNGTIRMKRNQIQGFRVNILENSNLFSYAVWK